MGLIFDKFLWKNQQSRDTIRMRRAVGNHESHELTASMASRPFLSIQGHMDMPQSKPGAPPNAWQLCHLDFAFTAIPHECRRVVNNTNGSNLQIRLPQQLCVWATRKMMGLLLASLKANFKRAASKKTHTHTHTTICVLLGQIDGPGR